MNTSKILEKIVGTDFYKAMEQEEIEQTIEERKKTAASVEALEKEALKTHQELQAKSSKKEAELNAVEEKTKKLKLELGRIQTKQGEASFRSSHTKTCLENSLRKTADTRIDDALNVFYKKEQALRAKGPSFSGDGMRFSWGEWALLNNMRSNIPEVNAALEYARDGFNTLEEMKLEPALDDEKLENLVSGLFYNRK